MAGKRLDRMLLCPATAILTWIDVDDRPPITSNIAPSQWFYCLGLGLEGRLKRHKVQLNRC
jgi:hypothetical protein